MDSSTVLLRLLTEGYQVTAISFDYGQKHGVELTRAAELVSYLNEIDGITISNTLPVSNNYLHTGKGGLSGKPLFNDTINTIKSVTKITNKNYPIIACGGISSAEEVWECIANGSKAVQLYTGLIYEGLSLPKLLSKNLIKMMHKAKINSISEIKGSAPKID